MCSFFYAEILAEKSNSLPAPWLYTARIANLRQLHVIKRNTQAPNSNLYPVK